MTVVLHRIRYRDAFQVRESFVEASPERARAVAEAYCRRENARLVGVSLATVADESILSEAAPVKELKPIKVSA